MEKLWLQIWFKPHNDKTFKIKTESSSQKI